MQPLLVGVHSRSAAINTHTSFVYAQTQKRVQDERWHSSSQTLTPSGGWPQKGRSSGLEGLPTAKERQERVGCVCVGGGGGGGGGLHLL